LQDAAGFAPDELATATAMALSIAAGDSQIILRIASLLCSPQNDRLLRGQSENVRGVCEAVRRYL
jgi:hypothetical protein